MPDDETIEERQRSRQGLTRPELAVLLSYNKLALADAALAGGMAEDDFLESWLVEGFPEQLAARFPQAVRDHRLKRELIVTLITNQMVDRLGIATAHRLPAGFGSRMEAAVRGYVLADSWLDGETLFNAIEAMDNQISAASQYQMHRIVIALLKHAMNWWLSTANIDGDLGDLVTRYQAGAQRLFADLPQFLAGSYRERWDRQQPAWQATGIDEQLAGQIASADTGGAIMDVVSLAIDHGRDVAEVAQLFYQLGDELGVPWLQDSIHQLPVNGRWQALARTSLRGDSYRIHQQIVAQVLDIAGDTPLQDWRAAHERTVAFITARLAELQTIEQPGHEHLTVAVRDLARLALPGPSSLGGAA